MNDIECLRGNILRAATQLFRSKGYHETRLDEIASACSVTENDILTLFTDKEYLALSVMESVQLYFDNNVLIFAYDHITPAYIRILKINDALCAFFSGNNCGCVFINFAIETLHSNPTFREPIRNYFFGCTNAYRVVLEDVYSPQVARTLAESIVADLQGALIIMRVTGESSPLDRLSARCAEALRASHTL